jgi:hypothetical protein
MKIPLKNKFFAWYLRRGVILTKDNLIKRNWHESKSCVFCSHDEIIKHLFFQCNFAPFIWLVIQTAWGLYPPTSIANVFRNWLHGIDSKYIILLRVRAMTLIWSLWLCRNDKVFDNKSSSLLLVIYRPTMVTASPLGGPRPLFGGVHAPGGYSEGLFFCIMDGSIICGLALHQPRRFIISHSDM